MRSILFVVPNLRSLGRSPRIPEEVWERYRPQIIREHASGGSTGCVRAREWIISQNIQGFGPSYKQLRHRIKVVWKEQASRSVEFKPLSETINNTEANDDFEAHQKGEIDTETITSEPTFLETAHPAPVLRVRDNRLLSGNRPLPLDIYSYKKSPTQDPASSSGRHGLNRSHLSVVTTRKRRERSPHLVSQMDPKRKRTAGEFTPYVRPMTMLLSTKPDIQEDLFNPGALLDNFQSEESPSPAQRFGDLSTSYIKDPVYEPRRIQRLLLRAGLACSINTISRYLRKAVVFHSSMPPTENILGVEGYSKQQIENVKAFANFSFASSNLDDAFPLFLIVWIIRRGDIGYGGLKLLVQCARSAVRTDDRVLAESLLKQQLSFLDKKSPQPLLAGSLECLELSYIFHQQGKKSSCNLYRQRALDICPSEEKLEEMIESTRRELPGKVRTDFFSCDIIRRSFFSASYKGEDFEEYTLRDVLYVVVHLTTYRRGVVETGMLHLRDCLRKALSIFQRVTWQESHEFWLGEIENRWPGCPRSAELAVFFDLFRNWSLGLVPYDEIEIEPENPLTGMSTLEIIQLIAFLVLNLKDITNPFYRSFDVHNPSDGRTWQKIVTTTTNLLKMQDDKLLLGTLWCSVKLSRRRAWEASKSASRWQLWKDWVATIFAQGMHVEEFNLDETQKTDSPTRESMMTDFSFNPSMAKSCSTSSTLSSMRRQSRMTFCSSIRRRSYQTTLNQTSRVDELVERSSLLTISDGLPSRPPTIAKRHILEEVVTLDELVTFKGEATHNNDNPFLAARLSVYPNSSSRDFTFSLPSSIALLNPTYPPTRLSV